MTDSFETILYEQDDGIVRITLNRPDKRNALTNTMLDELVVAFERADADKQDSQGRTALMVAAVGGHGIVVDALLQQGVDVHRQNNGGGNALMHAAMEGHEFVVDLLLQHGAEVNYQARVGGLAAFGFVEFPISPLIYRPGAEPPVFPTRFEWTPERLDYNVFRTSFDYYLVRTAVDQPTPPFWRGHKRPNLLFKSPRWALYERAP